MDVFKKINELLGGKGCCLVRTDERHGWYVHCWLNLEDGISYTNEENLEVYNGYTDDVDSALVDILNTLLESEDK